MLQEATTRPKPPDPAGESDARKTAHRQQRLALCLVLTAGYVDAYGLFALGAFVSVMSGNTTTIGLRLGRLELAAALPQAVAIVGFLLGSIAGALATYSGESRAIHRRLFGLVALLLAAAVALGAAPAARSLDIGILSLAMGMLNVAMSRIGTEPVSLTFVTGTLARVGRHLALSLLRAPLSDSEDAWDSHLHRALVGARLWGSFVLGALLCGLMIAFTREFALTPAFLAVLTLAAVGPQQASM